MTPLVRIARLSGAFLGSNFARGAIAFALSLVIGRTLGVERFGRWVLCTTWASTLTVVADLGFGVLLPRDGARSDVSHGRLLGGALVARMLILIPIGIVIHVRAAGLVADAESIAALRMAVLLGISGAAYGCFGATFRSQPAWVPTVLLVETVASAAQLGMSWVLVRGGAGIPALIMLATGVQLAQIASGVVLYAFAFEHDDPIRVPSWSETAAMVRRAIPFAASGLVANLQTRVGPLMLGYLSTQAEVGAFAAASRFGTVARLAPGAMFAGALPVLSSEYGRDRDDAGRAYRAFNRVLVAITLAAAVPFIVLAGPLLRLAYGESFSNGAPALMWVGVALVPAMANAGRKIFLYAAGGETIVLRWSAAALAIQIAISTMLMPVMGATGAAISLAVAEAAISWPLRTTPRIGARSSPHREPASTTALSPPAAHDVPDPAAAR
jgi:O-antigen/teichoic acid export membrane protein